MKNAVRLSERDNVAVLLEPLKAKEQLIYMDEAAALHSCTVMEDIPIYHKAALCDIQAGERIMKYGECIGIASTNIARGMHCLLYTSYRDRYKGKKTAVYQKAACVLSSPAK